MRDREQLRGTVSMREAASERVGFLVSGGGGQSLRRGRTMTGGESEGRWWLVKQISTNEREKFCSKVTKSVELREGRKQLQQYSLYRNAPCWEEPPRLTHTSSILGTLFGNTHVISSRQLTSYSLEFFNYFPLFINIDTLNMA